MLIGIPRFWPNGLGSYLVFRFNGRCAFLENIDNRVLIAKVQITD